MLNISLKLYNMDYKDHFVVIKSLNLHRIHNSTVSYILKSFHLDAVAKTKIFA